MTEADGDIIGFLGIADDLSEQKAMRANLRDSEARYRAVFENAGDTIFLIREGRFVDCNPATLEMFGRTRDEILGASPEDFSPKRQPDGQTSAARGDCASDRSGRPYCHWCRAIWPPVFLGASRRD